MIALLQLCATVYLALMVTALAVVVLRDSRLHMPYREDMRKLTAGMFVRAGRASVFGATTNGHDKANSEDGKDLSHELMLATRADS